MSRLRRLPPKSLRAAPLWFTPELVGRVLAVADALGAEPQPAPAPSQRKPIRLPRVVPTIGAIETVPAKVEERQAPSAPIPVPPAEAALPYQRPLPPADRVVSPAAEARAARRPVPAKAPMAIATLPSAPSAPRKPVPIGWVEQRMARSESAIAFLRGRGFALSRVLHFQNNEPTGRFHVSGYCGEFDRTQLLELALSLGFER